jgi:hypothetical protein
MKPWEQYQEEKGPWTQYSSADDESPNPVLQGIQRGLRTAAAPFMPDVSAGAVRGAGSIGATVLAPIDMALDKFKGKDPSGISRNDQRRQDMTSALGMLGADTESNSFAAGKLGAEILGTSGVGGLLGAAAQKLGMAPQIVQSLQTGGLRAAEATGLPALLSRLTGGAVTGGATAGLVDPDYAATGAALGAALPVTAQAAGKLGQAMRGPTLPVTQQTRDVAARGMAEGYVVPPSQVKPTFPNRVMESVSGKIATQQIASTKNQATTERLVRKALNLADDIPLSQETLGQYRAAQHAAGYEPVRQIGTIPASKGFIDKLDDIAADVGKSKSNIPSVRRDDIIKLVEQNKLQAFDSGDAVDAIRAMRENADQAYRKGDNIIGKAYKGIADAYEVAIDDALQQSGNPQLLQGYRQARQQIAKSFTVEKALREGAGTLDARVIAKELQKGKPLTGELRTVGEFANVFDKASLPPHLIGSPDVHNLKTFGSLAGGLGGFMTGGPVGGAAMAALPFVAPPAARSIMFSPSVQRGLLTPPAQMSPQTLQGLLQMTQRTTPVLAAQ